MHDCSAEHLCSDLEPAIQRFLTNAFSLSMLPPGSTCQIVAEEISEGKARLLAQEATSVVGHVPTAARLSQIFGWNVEVRRINISLGPNDELLVAQYAGPRLPEGATELPEDPPLRWFFVHLEVGCPGPPGHLPGQHPPV